MAAQLCSDRCLGFLDLLSGEGAQPQEFKLPSAAPARCVGELVAFSNQKKVAPPGADAH